MAASSSSFASGCKRRATDDESSLLSSKRQKLSSPASASGGSRSWKYDVFLSFRGEDTRNNFTDHLYAALHRKSILTFTDDERLVRGTEISSELTRAIEESRLSIVIFSEDYASSTWCLEELAKIVEFMERNNNHTVIPVFYNVDPSDVRKQSGEFKKAFDKHQQNPKIDSDKIQRWRAALERVANTVGDFISAGRSESTLVRDIVEDVLRRLMIEIENDFEGLIGIDKRIEQVMSLLCLGTMDVRTIGIWGMVGIGKTTLATAVFNRIYGQFDGSCFIEKVGERLEKPGALDSLVHEILSKLLDEQNLKLATPTILHPFIKERLNQKKVLIVFDDVNNFLQLETLVEVLNGSGLGSRMIMTSRDKQVLDNFVDDHDHIYGVDGLDHDEALELFSNYAFNQNHPTEDFMYLSVHMVYYAKGNPLALKVLGSSLQRKSKQEWESALDNLQGIGDSRIFNVLKISYDGLNDEEKTLFLDIACSFNGYFEVNIAKLLDCKYSLSVLVTKSLITIENGRRKMHDLLQEMGREIVRRESPQNPSKRSRLWKPDDVIRTLKNNSGTGAVEVISLEMDDLEDDLILGSQVFDKMHNLRLLLFTSHLNSHTVHLPDGLNSLPDELMILEWSRYPLRTLPSDFNPKKLVKLDLSRCNIEQLWEGTKHAPKLKWLILSYCQHLTRIPNLSGFRSLEEVDLTGCKSLVESPSSVQRLNKLRFLSLGGCSNVTKFPLPSRSIERLNLSETAIKEVRPSIQSLTNLTELDLSNCTRLKYISANICKLKSLSTLSIRDCSQLKTFPEILETMEFLKSLYLSGLAIKVLPPSIEHLNGLRFLRLDNCTNLEMLPSSICNLTSLENLFLSECSKLDKLPDNLGNLKSLKRLEVLGTAVGQLPSSITCLENLEFLDCSGCRGLAILPPLAGLRSLRTLRSNDCSLMEIPEDIGYLSSLEHLELSGNMFESLPKSIKHLSKLETLSVSHCNMLRSIPELPKGLKLLNAINCKQLCQALPDASEFKHCITSKYHKDVRFLFTNCFNLDLKAVSNVFNESLEGSEEPTTQFCIYLPGNKIPEWFPYQSPGSSINIRVLRQDLVNRKFMGFAICAVLVIEEYHHIHDFLAVDIYCHFETCDDHIYFLLSLDFSADDVFIDSNHILLGYSSFSKFLSSFQNLEMLPDGECDYVDFLFEFNYKSKDYEVKYCAVKPIYAKTMESLKALKLSAFSVIRPDSKLVGEIVETVCTEFGDFEGLIGIHKRIDPVKSLCLDMKDIRKIIGIWGMGGVGKTTIARAVFKSISHQFDGACFIEKVGKRLENGGSDSLQLEVLSEVLHEENLKLGTPTIRPFIMELLNQKKVFIVLDDVNNFSQLETLAQGLNQCGLGSRIIIISKDKQVLCNFNIDDHEIYEAEGFNGDEALELLHKHANPTKDCMALSEKIVNYAKGNPLALEVLGLSLKGMSKQVWESALKKLQGIVNSGIFDVLKISYDGLNEEEKKIFLDLACFGDLYNYHGLLKEEFLDCMHLEYSLNVLVAKSLITKHKRTGDIEMHDLLQEMGREVVRRESPNNPGKRSRLWERNDVIRTLEKNTGTDAVEVISLDMDGLEDEDIHLNSQVFNKMHNLRFLIFHSMYGSDKVLHLPNDLNCLPDELMFLHWLGYPLKVLPLNFKPKKLVKLDLSGSNIEQLWEGTKRAPKLKWLNLSYCEHLTRIPNLSDFPLLVEVDLSHCKSLVDFPYSVQQLNNLRNLNMSDTAIEEVPSSIQSLTNLTELKLAECTRLKHISTSICKLKSLSTLDLTDCSELEIFPEILETMESLKSLKLSAFLKINMDLKVLHPSIERLNGLRSLTLNGCENLEMLPDSICNLTSLEDLYLSYCSKPIKLPVDLGNLKSLKHLTVRRSAVGQLPSSITCLKNLEGLDCSGCSLMEIPEDIGCLSSLKKLELSENMFESLPKSIKKLSKLEFLSLSHCNMLRSLPEFPEGLECLEAMDCDQLCQVPDASKFVRCINSKSHRVDFIFINSLNLIDQVSNVFVESLQIMQRTEKGSGKPPNEFSIYLPGNKIPKRFYTQSLDHGICNKIHHESSINIKVLQNDLVNRKFMGFAIWAVFGCDENNTRVRFTHGVGCVFETYYDHIKICNGNRIYRTHYGSDLPSIFIDSDHMLLGYCSFYSRNHMKPPASDSDHVDISIELKIHDNGNQLKHWAVRPIYAVQEIGETSGRRNDPSDDNDEEVEPHPKRICTQEI